MTDAALSLEDYVDALTNLSHQGHARYAAADAERVALTDPLAGHVGRACVAAAMNDRATMSAAVAAAEAIAPEHPQVLQAKAILTGLVEGPAAAVAAARKVAQAVPTARSRNGLARVLIATGAAREAVQILEALAAELDDPDARVQLAAIAPEGGAALDHLVAAFVRTPNDPRPMQSLMDKLRENSWPIGVAILAREVGAHAASPGLRYVAHLLGLAAALYLRGTPWEKLVPMPDSVFADARAAAAEIPVEAQATLAGLLIDHGRLDDARSFLMTMRGRATTPAELAAHAFCAGRLADADGQMDRAVANYRTALVHDPRNALAASNLIDLLMREGTPQTLAEIPSLLAGLPEVTRRLCLPLTFNEAVWHERQGRTEQALALVRFMLEGPLGPFGGAVRDMAARLEGA